MRTLIVALGIALAGVTFGTVAAVAPNETVPGVATVVYEDGSGVRSDGSTFCNPGAVCADSWVEAGASALGG